MKIGSVVAATKAALTAIRGMIPAPGLPLNVTSSPPPGERILILAPHADDETLGCGGSIKKYIDSGKHVEVVILTDGRLGDPDIRATRSARSRAEREHALIALRQQETRDAMDTLGVNALTFLAAADGRLASADGIFIESLLRRFDLVRPDIVFVPFFLDRHPDHQAATACLDAVYQRLGRAQDVTLAAYEIWSPLAANTLVDISSVADFKWQAIAAYQSQLKDVDYLSATKGLNRFRAIAGLLPGSVYAEAFFVCPLPTYLELYRQYKSG